MKKPQSSTSQVTAPDQIERELANLNSAPRHRDESARECLGDIEKASMRYAEVLSRRLAAAAEGESVSILPDLHGRGLTIALLVDVVDFLVFILSRSNLLSDAAIKEIIRELGPNDGIRAEDRCNERTRLEAARLEYQRKRERQIRGAQNGGFVPRDSSWLPEVFFEGDDGEISFDQFRRLKRFQRGLSASAQDISGRIQAVRRSILDVNLWLNHPGVKLEKDTSAKKAEIERLQGEVADLQREQNEVQAKAEAVMNFTFRCEQYLREKGVPQEQWT